MRNIETFPITLLEMQQALDRVVQNPNLGKEYGIGSIDPPGAAQIE